MRCDWWAPGGVTWCTVLQSSSHRYTSEDGEDGGDVAGGLQVKESGVLGSSPPSNRYTSEDGEDGGDVTVVEEPCVLGSSPTSNRYTSKDGEDGGDVTDGLQVKEPGVLGFESLLPHSRVPSG